MSNSTSEFQKGVIAAEKIWLQAIPELLRQGTDEVSYLECTVCNARYQLPKDPPPQSQKIFCPRCFKYDSARVGICKEVKRTVTITNMAWHRETNHATVVVESARRLIATLQRGQINAVDSNDLTARINRLEADCDLYEQQRSMGWDNQNSYHTLTLEALKAGAISPIPLQPRVNSTKERECPTLDGS